MSVRCSVGDKQAIITDGNWQSDDSALLKSLRILAERDFPQWGPSDGDPDYREAEYCMSRLGGRIVDYDELPDDGKVY